MANLIKIKRSAVQGKIPLAADLDLGELAVNTYDGKLFTKKNDGSDSITEIGARGYTGSIGYTGSQGIQGDTGFVGSQGEQGTQGLIGYTGSQGEQGIQGYTGSQGDQGIQGYTGSQGDIGFTGSQGDQGIQGDVGFTGSQGSIGFTGSQGLGFTPLVGGQNWNTNGSLIGTNVYWYVPSPPDTGAFAVGNYILLSDTTSGSTYYYYGRITLIQFAGGFGWALHADILSDGGIPVGGTSSSWITELTGEQGIIGYTGSQGATGFTGSQGNIGYTGSQGIQGDIGYTGSQGDIGYTGSKGTDGTSVTILGTLSDPIDLPSVGNNSGDGYIIDGDLYVWDGDSWNNVGPIQGPIGYTGSQGNQGNIGYTGSQGNIGFNGYTGSQGSQGFTGSKGDQGLIGYTGSQGDQGVIGYTGSQGIQGDIGYTGSVGSQGDQGLIGYTGSQGEQGIQGNIGYTGSQGSTGFTGSQGIQGEQGLIGYTGSQGGQGDVGYTGSQGSQGVIGYTGSASTAIGYTGSQGNIGYTGSKGEGSSVTASPTAPSSPAAGDLWWDSENGQLKIYYVDTDSSQWVDAVASAIGYTGSQGAIGYTGSGGGGSSTLTIVNKTANYTVVADDAGKVINCVLPYPSESITISLTAATTLGAGFNCTIWNSSNSDYWVTIDPNGSETINDNSTLILRAGEGTQIICDGTKWYTGNKKSMKLYAENAYAGSYNRPVATGYWSFAIGEGANSTGSQTVAIGRACSASGDSTVALGPQTSASGSNSIAIGRNSGYQSAVAVGGGTALAGSYASSWDSFATGIASNSSSYGAKGGGSIAMGQFCVATNDYSVAIGQTTTASNTYAVAIGGNTAASGFASIALGYLAQASGSNSVAIGGQAFIYGPLANASNAVAIGSGAYSDIQGKLAFSSTDHVSGAFIQGVQSGLYVLKGSTTSSTPFVIRTDGSNSSPNTSNQIILPNSSAYSFTIKVVGLEQTGSGTNCAGYTFSGVIKRVANAASTTLLASTKTVDYESDASWDCNITADTTNGGLAITVTGSDTNIRWCATAQTAEVIYA